MNSDRVVTGVLITLSAAFCLSSTCAQQDTGGRDVVASATTGATITARSFTVPAGQTTIVTSDLTVNASGDVKIDGQLIAQPTTTAGGKGVSISIIAQGNIEVTGAVQAGDGQAGLATSATMTISQANQGGTDPPGGDGGSLELDAGGSLTIGQSATVGSGSGGAGAAGSWGGAGGQGGDLALGAGGTLTVQGRLLIGNGGHGGTPSPTAPVTGVTLGGRGGNSGVLFARAATANWPGYDPQANTLQLGTHPSYAPTVEGTWSFEGGIGGSGGLVSLIEDPTATLGASDAHRTASQVRTRVCAAHYCFYGVPNGGDGFFSGGVGGSIQVAITMLEPGEWDGSTISVYAGHGGSVGQRQHPKWGGSVIGKLAMGGAGGMAQAIASHGRYGTDEHRHAGSGGSASAYGGNGGSASSVNVMQFGGPGGLAEAYGGFGGWGNSGCTIIGDGGAGGIANAFGGNGGSGGWAGKGGDARANGGHGGDGGSGGPGAGAAGNSGAAIAKGGDPGQYNPAWNPTPPSLVGNWTATPGQHGTQGEVNSQVCD